MTRALLRACSPAIRRLFFPTAWGYCKVDRQVHHRFFICMPFSLGLLLHHDHPKVKPVQHLLILQLWQYPPKYNKISHVIAKQMFNQVVQLPV